ncbi:MAG TPA: hypothetical protein VF950_02555 [Planctomycetota bacterium]
MTIHVSAKVKRASELLLAIKAMSPARVDARKLTSFVDERREIVWHMAEAVRDQAFDAVAGDAFGAWVAELAGLPLVGELKPGQKVLLVEDDAASLSAPLQALRGAGAIVEHAAVVFYDGTPLPAGITLHAMTTWSHMIDAAEAFKVFPPDQLKSLRAFLEKPRVGSVQ